MSKMFFNNPIIIVGGGMNDEGDPIIDIPDSAQGGVNSIARGYTEWSQGYGVDLVDPVGTINEADYVQWWTNMMAAGYNGFTQADWNRLNPNWEGTTPNFN